MKILRVVGLGIAIVMLKFLIPHVFSGFEETLIAFFKTLQAVLAQGQSVLPAAASLK